MSCPSIQFSSVESSHGSLLPPRTTSAYRGFSDTGNNSWIPIPSLNRTDADVSLVFITANLVTYSTPVNDVVFQANGSIKNPIEQGNGQPMYISDFNARIIACADQREFCNPTNGVCSGLDGYLGSATQPFSSESTAKQLATALRIQRLSEVYTIEGSVKQLGNSGKERNRETKREKDMSYRHFIMPFD